MDDVMVLTAVSSASSVAGAVMCHSPFVFFSVVVSPPPDRTVSSSIVPDSSAKTLSR
jgi:hypothetical protein